MSLPEIPADPAQLIYTPSGKAQAIRASSVLPAIRENIELRTADGETLVGELAMPEGQPVAATMICLHPLPTEGGFMDSHVFRKASYRLPALAGIAVLRFNTRGTSSARGTSTGSFSDGVEEREDVIAAVRFAVERGLPNIWLVGWSFGTELALKYGAVAPVADSIQGAVLLSPPLHRAQDSDLDQWAASGKPLEILVPERDDFLTPDEAVPRFARIPQAQVRAISDARHLWVGEKYVGIVLAAIASRLRGESVTLPQEWQGPMAHAG